MILHAHIIVENEAPLFRPFTLEKTNGQDSMSVIWKSGTSDKVDMNSEKEIHLSSAGCDLPNLIKGLMNFLEWLLEEGWCWPTLC